MKKILMTGCKYTRNIKYYNSYWNYDEDKIEDGYKINNENPYNKIETDKGIDIDEWRKGMNLYNIYEEGFCVMEGTAPAHYIGSAFGDTFIEACENFIKQINRGVIQFDKIGNKYASDWGCRWFPTLEEAQHLEVKRK